MLFQRENKENTSGCAVFTSQPISLAMAYVPRQEWEDLYEAGLGLERGTIFSQLDKPFIGVRREELGGRSLIRNGVGKE